MDSYIQPKRMRTAAHLKLNPDLTRYRNGYPGATLNNERKNRNVRFYRNEIRSDPQGECIDIMHKEWATDYRELELNHGYIQWLFPIHEEGVNDCAQVLQRHEAETMKNDTTIRERIKRSYTMMLQFYGARVVDWDTGELERTPQFVDRFKNLNEKRHNFLRITRILKFLGEVDFEYLKLPFLKFFAREALVFRTLPSIIGSLRNYWAGTLKSDQQLRQYISLLNDPARLQEPSPKKLCTKEDSNSEPAQAASGTTTTAAKLEPAEEGKGTSKGADVDDSGSQEQSQATTVAAEDDELDPDSVEL